MKTIRAGIIMLALAGTLTTSHAQTLTDSALTLTQIVSGLDQPIGLEFLATNDLLVLEKASGQVRRVIDGVLQVDPVLDLAVDSSDERGILSIVKHPGFATNHFVYICSTPNGTPLDSVGTDPTCICIDRYEWDGNVLTNVYPIFGFTPSPSVDYHNGGAMTFGPDGKLYVVTGDHEQSGQNQNYNTTGPDDTSVIVRLEDDGLPALDNPFHDISGMINVYAYGVRNSFGLTFDPVTGKLWDTENGEDEYDEINLVEPGFNSGWRRIMGPLSRHPSSTNSLVIQTGSQYADPKFSWLATVAPTGIAFVNSTALGAAYENDLFVGDFNNGFIYHFDLNAQRDALVLSGNLSDKVADNANERDSVVIGTDFGLGTGTETGISALKVGPDGKLYVVSLVQGKIFAIYKASGTTPVHDLAVVSLKAPKKINLKGTPVIKPVKIAIQNLGNQTETIADATALQNLINFTIESLGDCPVPTTALVTPKSGFPVVLAAKKKLSVSINVTFDCVNNGATGIGNEDFRYTVNLSTDGVLTNNDCPRAPGGSDKKGCGGKGGTPVLTDVSGAQ